MTTTPVLAVNSLTGGYGPVTVLRNVSFDVRPGEIVTLLGSNGAGKSTLLNTIAGLQSPTAGEVTFEGTQVGGRSAESIARTGIVLVPEGRQLFAGMTVRENLRLGAYLKRRDRRAVAQRFDQVLELFPVLKGRLAAPASSLSGGQQQMLAIGRGLMAEPKLLLLDEPSLGLAPLVLKEVFDVIRQLRQLGVTVLLVEQNAKLALGLADRGYVLERGEISISGSAGELLADERVRTAYLGLGAVTAPEVLRRNG